MSAFWRQFDHRHARLGRRVVPVVVGVILLGLSSTTAAQHKPYNPHPKADNLSKASVTQRLNHQVPGDLRFQTTDGESISLRDYFGGDRPIILALGYVHCPNLCTLIHESLVESLKKVPLKMGEDFQVLSVSIDPHESADLMRAARQRYLQLYGEQGAGKGWHSLMSDKANIAALNKAVGFTYAYDKKTHEFSHAGALVVLTPDGKVSRYFYGIKYDPGDLKLGLIDASKGTIGSPVDKLLLRCCSYDPKTGKYSLQIMNVIRVAGAATTLILGLGLFFAFRRNRHFEQRG